MIGRRRDERGSILPMTVFIVVVVLAISALTVDLGVKKVARSDMQALANVVALDLARHMQGRTKSSIVADPTWASELTKSVGRNSTTVGSHPDVGFQLGRLDGATGDFSTVDDSAVPTAVKVTAKTSVNFTFTSGSGTTSRSAVATSSQTACFQLGSFALAVNSGNSALLNGLIGDALNLSALGYDGLATANVSLLGLGAQLGAGTPDELLGLSEISLGRLYLAAATVLQNEGGSAAQVTLLQTIGTQVGSLPPVDVAKLVGVSQDSGSALSGQVNLLDLVATSAFMANGESALAIPNLAINLGLANLSSSLKVIEKPRTYCGPINGAPVENAQVRLNVTGNLLNVPRIAGLAATVGVNLSADLASGTGTLRNIICGTPEGVDVEVQNALTNVSLNLTVHLVGDLGLVAVTVDVPVTAATTRSMVSSTAQVRVPSLTYSGTAKGARTTTPVQTGSGTVGLNGLAVTGTPVISAKLLGVKVGLPIPIGDITGPLLSTVVNPLIGNLDQLLLGPLTDLLGLNVAGSDVFGVRSPDCGGVKLVG